MVHNGIEYGDMQLICEAYQFMKDGLGLSYEEMHQIFNEWNKTELDSYLVEITAAIFRVTEMKTSEPLVEKILIPQVKRHRQMDPALMLDLGIPLTLISKPCLHVACPRLKTNAPQNSLFGKTVTPLIEGDEAAWVDAFRQALLASKSFLMQGFMLIREASENNDWALNYGNTALLWRKAASSAARSWATSATHTKPI